MIGKYLDCTTGHITKKDDLLLQAEYRAADGPVSVGRYLYGMIIFLPFKEEIEDELKKIKEWGYSDDFISLIKYASSKETTLLILDRDGQVIDGLNVNDW